MKRYQRCGLPRICTSDVVTVSTRNCRIYPHACRSMCGCTGNGNFTVSPVHATILRNPAAVIEQRRVEGRPDSPHVSTSYAKRANLTLRMGSRRFTRLTNGFSKKVENHAHSVAIHTMHYNFVRIHQTLRCTPATAAGVTTTL